MTITISDKRDIQKADVIQLYLVNEWSAAHKPEALYAALMSSHTLVTAWQQDNLVGLGNAISDGHLVVYYPHLLVHPDFHGLGIGRRIVEKLQEKYKDFHMQMLTADGGAIDFYTKMGFERAGKTAPMWIYQGKDH